MRLQSQIPLACLLLASFVLSRFLYLGTLCAYTRHNLFSVSSIFFVDATASGAMLLSMQTLFYRSNTGSAGVCTHRKNTMTTQTQWTASDITKAQHRGILELESGDYFEILETKSRIVFGNACNAGFLESGYMLRDESESMDEALRELHDDLECYYRDGAQYVSRIVCNERM